MGQNGLRVLNVIRILLQKINIFIRLNVKMKFRALAYMFSIKNCIFYQHLDKSITLFKCNWLFVTIGASGIITIIYYRSELNYRFMSLIPTKKKPQHILNPDFIQTFKYLFYTKLYIHLQYNRVSKLLKLQLVLMVIPL